MQQFFNFKQHKTSYRQETVAGITTFLATAYIIVVNPAILEAAGIPRGPSITATILTAVFGTLVMGVYAKRPFAIAPYMGENAFIAFTVVKGLGLSWQVALGAIFIAGVLFTILTVLKVRSWMVNAIPLSLRYSFTVGIGLFLCFIGMNESGMVALGVPGAPVTLGTLSAPPTLIAIGGFFLTAALLIRRVTFALLAGIVVVTGASMLLGITAWPHEVFSAPESLKPIFGQLDIAGALSWKSLPVVVLIFIMAFLDTIGTLVGLSSRAGLLDQKGNLPQIEKPMLADALANIVAPLLGTTTSGAYIESAAGIEAGGRTGFVALVISALFLVALFLTPILTLVPGHAYGPALILIGAGMLAPIAKMNFRDQTEWLPSFLTIALISFTFNIGVGITAGLIAYPLLKLFAARGREVPAALWLLAALSLLFYLVYPWHK
ncbi:MAG TPA: NCS2 family permease [Verrucomicrobiae bacterium]